MAPLTLVPSGSQDSATSLSERSIISGVSKPGTANSVSSTGDGQSKLPRLDKKRKRRKRKNGNPQQNGTNQASYPPVRNPSLTNGNQFYVKPSLIPRWRGTGSKQQVSEVN